MSADPCPTSSQSLAALRLDFSPSYILVGVYRLSTDASLRVPVWQKCKHGFVRGLLVGLVWVSVAATTIDDRQWTVFSLPGVLHVWNSKGLHPILHGKVCPILVINYRIHSHPHARSARVTGLSNRSFFGYTVPFELATCMPQYTSPILISQFIHPTVAALLAVGEQANIILNFFLRRNIAIAKQRVWDQTVASRGKGPSFWKPYVEEWDRPPVITKPGWDSWLSGSAARFVIRKSE